MGTNLGRYCGRNQCSLEEMKMCEKKIAVRAPEAWKEEAFGG